LAQKENRILITFDKDFGELAFRYGLSARNGIILFRMRVSSPMKIAQAAVAALESRDDWSGKFGVVEETRIRLTRLPQK
jgi:predicted nuclease of predicted toxin-antitoxin system